MATATARQETMEAESKQIQHDPIVTTEMAELAIPGVVVEFDPDEAERLGAFEETALSEEDAWDSNDGLSRSAREPGDARE